MRHSIITGDVLPESPMEYEELCSSNRARYTTCCSCDKTFSQLNVKTPLGWAETQITGFCENCFDSLFDEGDEE